MKKSLIYTLSIIALIISVSFTTAVNSLTATESTDTPTVLNSNSDLADAAVNNSLSKFENIYIIVNPDGTISQSFIGSTINTSLEPLPLSLKITYSLDGHEIEANELVGKSGHAKITYTFTSTKSYQEKLIPFLTVTSLSLDSAKFTNIKIDHGKIISESDTTILAGYTFAGLAEDLGTDILSNQFTVEADVTNFELADTYTFATNELFTDFDTTKLTDIDGIINSINDLAAGFDQILAGSTKLTKGSTDLASGANQLVAGLTDLTNGANNLAAGTDQLSNGLSQLVDFDNSIIAKIDTTTAEVTSIIQNLIEEYDIDPESELIKQLNTSVTNYYNTAHTAIITYTGNIEKLATGANQLSGGAHQLANGANQLKSGAVNLADGANQLASGTTTLNSGLTIFRNQGINQLVDFANQNLATFTDDLRATVAAAKSYHHYFSTNAQSVKFVFKTPSIK